MPAQVNTQQREPVYRAASFANLPSPHPSQCSSSPLPVLCSYRATSITPSLRPHGYTNTVTSSTNDKPTHLAAHTSAAAAAFFVSGNDPATQDGRVSICHLQSDSSTRSQLPQASTPLPKPFASSQDDGVDFKHQQQTTSPVQTSSTLPTYPPSASSSRLLPTLLAAAANYSVSWQPPNSLMTISPGSQSCQTTATPPPFTSLQVSREAAVPEQSHPILTTTVPAVATPNTTTHIPSSAIIATSLTATSTSSSAVSTHAVSSTQTLVSTAPSAQLISDTCTVVTPPSYPEYPQLSPGASHPTNTGSSSRGTTHECSPPQQLGDRDLESPAETDPPPVLSQNRSSPCEHHQQSLLHDDDLPVSSLSHTPHCVQQPHNLTTVAGNDTIQLQSPPSNNPSQSVIVLSQEDSEPTLSLTPPLNHHTSDKDVDRLRGTAAASSGCGASGGDPVEAPQPNPLAEHGTDPSSTDDYPRKLTEDALVRGGGSLTDELKEGKGSSVSPHLPRDDISGGHDLDMSSSSSKCDGHPPSLSDTLACDPTQNAGRDVGVVVRVSESVSELSEHSSSEDRHAAGVHRAESTTTEQITAQLRTESETDGTCQTDKCVELSPAFRNALPIDLCIFFPLSTYIIQPMPVFYSLYVERLLQPLHYWTQTLRGLRTLL